MSFQGSALFGSMTVGENVALPLREHTKLEDSTIEIMLRLKLEQVGLAGFEYYMPSQLSGGMKKRAAVARALAMDPEILFFDEPSAGLDPIIAAGIDQLILELKRAFRMTIIVVTHELASAFLIADRMVLIDKGNVVAIGTVEEMKNEHAATSAPVSGSRRGAGSGARTGLFADADRRAAAIGSRVGEKRGADELERRASAGGNVRDRGGRGAGGDGFPDQRRVRSLRARPFMRFFRSPEGWSQEPRCAIREGRKRDGWTSCASIRKTRRELKSCSACSPICR